jgi:drug/metabolite transporter (DMT)-like permease
VPDRLDHARRIAAYAVLYLVWGSTYLAMRFAVETLPPFLLAGARFTVAGAILYAIGSWRNERSLARRQWLRALVVGFFLCVGGNGLVLWAVQHVPSGTAALVIATTPLWLALLSRARFSLRLAVGIALGLCGVAILVGPAMLAGSARVDPIGVGVLCVAAVLWAIGSMIQRGGDVSSAIVATGAQMLCGGGMLLVFGTLAGELGAVTLETVSTKSALALLYLTVFGSFIGFTSYAWLMRRDEPARVGTYAYVNPIVAVVLGALLGGEAITLRVLIAASVIVIGVVAILRRKD